MKNSNCFQNKTHCLWHTAERKYPHKRQSSFSVIHGIPSILLLSTVLSRGSDWMLDCWGNVSPAGWSGTSVQGVGSGGDCVNPCIHVYAYKDCLHLKKSAGPFRHSNCFEIRCINLKIQAGRSESLSGYWNLPSGNCKVYYYYHFCIKRTFNEKLRACSQSNVANTAALIQCEKNTKVWLNTVCVWFSISIHNTSNCFTLNYIKLLVCESWSLLGLTQEHYRKRAKHIKCRKLISPEHLNRDTKRGQWRDCDVRESEICTGNAEDMV